MPLAPGTRVERYTVLALLGAGGMGEVYRARDERLGREVALKVLPAEIAKDREALTRLEQEARAAAKLSHPGIVTLFDVVGGADGAFLTMELVEGRSLRDALGAGPLPADRAIQLARDVAEALAHAHGAGIVHRDLKPENLMLAADGRVRILDFGLAVAASAPLEGSLKSATTAVRLTRPGTVVGTVSYMAPEQAQGRPIDYRADQFSLGVLLHEMLAGRRPFGGGSVLEVLTAIQRDAPAPLPDPIEREHPGVQAIVSRCLARDPGQRYASTADLARDLGRLAASQSGPPTHAARAWTLASRTSRAAGALALVAGLVAAGVGLRTWRRGGTDGSARGRSSVAGAQDAYAQGRYYAAKGNPNEQDRSIPPFERAVALDPAFGAAWSELAGQYARKAFQGDPQRTWETKAVSAIRRALDLNPDAAEALVARGNLAFTKLADFPYERIAADFRHALAVAPDNADAHQALGSLYLHVGLLDRAMEHLEAARRLNPGGGFPVLRIGRTLWFQGRYAEALDLLQGHPETAHGFEVPIVLLHLGRAGEARRLVDTLGASPHAYGQSPSDIASVSAVTLAKAGDAEASLRQIEETLRSDDGGSHFHHAAYNLAVAYALLGKREEAVVMLDRVAREGMPCYPLFARDPFLAALHGYPAFEDFLGRMKTQHEHFRVAL